jgi:hypothetical protein
MRKNFHFPLSLIPSATLASFAHCIRWFFWGKSHSYFGRTAEGAEKDILHYNSKKRKREAERRDSAVAWIFQFSRRRCALHSRQSRHPGHDQ